MDINTIVRRKFRLYDKAYCHGRCDCYHVGFLNQQFAGFMTDFSDLGFGNRSASPQLGNGSDGVNFRSDPNEKHMKWDRIRTYRGRSSCNSGRWSRGRGGAKARNGRKAYNVL